MTDQQGVEVKVKIGDLSKVLQDMHVGLLTMQARLDDHQKVIEQVMLVLQNLTSGQVPNGFRQPKKGH